MRASDQCLGLIRRSESFRAKPYLCPAGIPSIGYGSTRYEDGRRVTLQDPSITQDRAEQLLAHDVQQFEAGVMRLVRVPLTQGQFDALVSFAYNVGLDENNNGKAEGLGESTLLKKLNAGDYRRAADQFPLWNKGGGVVLPGLVTRRAAERAMFLGAA